MFQGFLTRIAISDKTLTETLCKISLPLVSPLPFQCCFNHVSLKSHLNIREGSGVFQGFLTSIVDLVLNQAPKKAIVDKRNLSFLPTIN